MKIVDTLEHYEALIDEGNDPFWDPPVLQEYMSRWDGPKFFDLLDCNKKSLLEVGIGTGRIAKQVLNLKCDYLVGIDISPKTLHKAQENLKEYFNLELYETDICDFIRPNTFDIVYCVLTFLHINDKQKAFQNIWLSLKAGGKFILSIGRDDEWLEYNNRKIKQYPVDIEEYINLYKRTGFEIEAIVETESKYATIIKGRKI